MNGEHLLRELAPQVRGAVVRRYGDFGAAEDAVQEALIAAAVEWRRTGVPEDPRAWLIPVAGRKHAVAVAMARGPTEELALLEKLDRDPRIKDHYWLDAVRAHLLERSGKITTALPYYEAAAEKTASIPERSYLLLKIAGLRAGLP